MDEELRVLVHERKPQEYGTQMTRRGGKWVPFEPPEIGEWLTITCTGCGREMRIIGSQT
ncbi:MAG TPA: hypothetical protein VMI73_04650 [Trebonia sp.]|nr:hypothetical protein [Trebonia sp.]